MNKHLGKSIDRVLLFIHSRLSNKNIIWALTGSCNFVLQGMNTEIHDIDIQTDKYSAYKIEEIFRDFRIKPVRYSSAERIRSHFGEFKIFGIKVEIMGDIQKKLPGDIWEEPVNLENIIHNIEYKSIKIPVISLEHEQKAYEILGRIKTSKMIKDFISSQKDL